LSLPFTLSYGERKEKVTVSEAGKTEERDEHGAEAWHDHWGRLRQRI